MAASIVSAGRTTVVVTLVFAVGVIGDPVRRAVRAQDPRPQPGEAKRSERAIEELRGLIAELEVQADRERTQLQMTEASVRRARALLKELEIGPSDREEGQRSHTVHSARAEQNLPEQAAAQSKEWRWAEELTTRRAVRNASRMITG
jgi:hypothetical protein